MWALRLILPVFLIAEEVTIDECTLPPVVSSVIQGGKSELLTALGISSLEATQSCGFAEACNGQTVAAGLVDASLDTIMDAHVNDDIWWQFLRSKMADVFASLAADGMGISEEDAKYMITHLFPTTFEVDCERDNSAIISKITNGVMAGIEISDTQLLTTVRSAFQEILDGYFTIGCESANADMDAVRDRIESMPYTSHVHTKTMSYILTQGCGKNTMSSKVWKIIDTLLVAYENFMERIDGDLDNHNVPPAYQPMWDLCVAFGAGSQEYVFPPANVTSPKSPAECVDAKSKLHEMLALIGVDLSVRPAVDAVALDALIQTEVYVFNSEEGVKGMVRALLAVIENYEQVSPAYKAKTALVLLPIVLNTFTFLESQRPGANADIQTLMGTRQTFMLLLNCLWAVTNQIAMDVKGAAQIKRRDTNGALGFLVVLQSSMIDIKLDGGYARMTNCKDFLEWYVGLYTVWDYIIVEQFTLTKIPEATRDKVHDDRLANALSMPVLEGHINQGSQELYMTYRVYQLFLGIVRGNWVKREDAGSTTSCLQKLADENSTCASVFSAGARPFEPCPKAMLSEMKDRGICACNPAIREISELQVEDCVSVDSPADWYGCDLSDTAVDQLRVASLRRYNAALFLSKDDLAAEFRAIFAQNATYAILGVDPYVGVDAIIDGLLFLNPYLADKLVQYGSALEVRQLHLDDKGFVSVFLDMAYAHGSELKFAQGSYNSVEFLPCSGTVTSMFRALDDFSFRAIVVQPHTLARYTAIESMRLPTATYSWAGLSAENAHAGKRWAIEFHNQGTHECVPGLWSEAAFLYTWQMQEDSGLECLVLGKRSYLKIFQSDIDGEMEFALRYENSLSDIDIKGTKKFLVVTDENGELQLHISMRYNGGTFLGDMEIGLGSSKCRNLWMLKFCGSWGEDSDARRLNGILPPVDVYVEVGDEETERITIWDPNVNAITTTTTPTRPVGADWSWSASLSGPIAVWSSCALLYI